MTWAKVAIAAIALTIAYLVGWGANELYRDNQCPTEDSCEADYRDGSWHIEPTTP